MKNASNGEVLSFKKTLEQEFGSLLANTPGEKKLLSNNNSTVYR
jgi:hypothetical protein